MSVLNFHIVRDLPAACVNRDETGAPKTIWYGGAIRGRISSQAIKRAIRIHMSEHGITTGIRTRAFAKLLAPAMPGATPDEQNEKAQEAAKLIMKVLVGESSRRSADDEQGGVVTFLSLNERDILVEAVSQLATIDEKSVRKAVEHALGNDLTEDILLFGRLMTDQPDHTTDGLLIVSQALGTHKVEQEIDYMTAIDEVDPNGAGHIGSLMLNSTTYYQHIALELELAMERFGERFPIVLDALIRAIIAAVPGGRKRSMAAMVRPAYVGLVCTAYPLTVSAFNRPITDNILETSVDRLHTALSTQLIAFEEALSDLCVLAPEYHTEGQTGIAKVATTTELVNCALTIARGSA